ncbi:hypothetical protein V3N99_08305 [Dermatophilaceae bacterium Soc4.6]
MTTYADTDTGTDIGTRASSRARASARPVSVDELRRAWHAVQQGQFRGSAHRPAQRPSLAGPPGLPDLLGPPRGITSDPPGADLRWAATERVLPVVGCVGQAGASTLALAIATEAATRPATRPATEPATGPAGRVGTQVGRARVIECCTAGASGLTSAVTAELGVSENGWSLGRRERVWVARPTAAHRGVEELPLPDEPPPATALTVLDVGWELGQVLTAGGWVSQTLTTTEAVVAVTRATIPGLRRLESALTMLSIQGASRPLIAVVGPARRRWPRHLAAAMGPRTRAGDTHGHLVTVPLDKQLALRGLDSAPLPPALLQAATLLLHHLEHLEHLDPAGETPSTPDTSETDPKGPPP